MLVGPDHDLCPSVTLEVSQFDNWYHSTKREQLQKTKKNKVGLRNRIFNILRWWKDCTERKWKNSCWVKHSAESSSLPPWTLCPRADCVTSPSITPVILYLCTQPPLLNCGPQLKAPQWRHPEMSTRSYLWPVLTRDPTPSYPSLCPRAHNSHEAGAALPKVEF